MTVYLSLKNYKIYVLQKEYIKISDILYKLQNHINNIYIKFMLDIKDYNDIFTQLYNIVRTINKKHNCYVIDECTSDVENELFVDENIEIKLKCLCDGQNNHNEAILFEKIYNISKLMDVKHTNILPDKIINIQPLAVEWEILIKIIKQVGYSDINNCMKIINYNYYKSPVDKETEEYINSLNNIFVISSISVFDVENESRNYYWRDIINRDHNDYLHKKVEFWVKNNLKNKSYFKLIGFFPLDTLNILNKTSQLYYNHIYNKKKEINEIIKKKNYTKNKFIKNFIKYIDIKYLICNTTNEIINYIETNYKLYMHLMESNFINIMKLFIAEETTIYKMHQMIYLLLLDGGDKEDIGGLLYGLTKEKKLNSTTIANLIFNNLNYFFQSKLKETKENLKTALIKFKSNVNTDINYKKQLLINKNIPNNIKQLALEKIEEMKMNNNEYYKQLIYVKYLVKFPWPSPTDNLFFQDLNKNGNKAKKYIETIETRLNNLSYGHQDAKKSLLLIIGKWISNPLAHGSSIGLVGPPGVGKTLLAKNVSDALDIPFIQITLGGQNDGELLHGHGYTYSGSQPGMIIRKMADIGKNRCIIYFDELDKACSKHGQTNEITSILIHLTDPNMNKEFQDRFYQGINFPLNKVIFMFSYNDSSLIDPILLDRIKEIEIKSYVKNDKINIVKNFIIPEIKKNINFNDYQIILSTSLIEFIIDEYTNEAGVRSIKRKIETIFLSINLDKIYKRNKFKTKKKKIIITKKDITTILNKTVSNNLEIHKQSEVGIINGLYATTTGNGGIIPIQIYKNYSINNTNFELKLTGNQGDVMKESVNCSYTSAVDFISKNLDKFKHINNIEEYISNNFANGFHIHTPSTSVPKDGPSAGGAFTITFISRILNIPIKNDIAMTGEIELTGNITKIGGLQYKLIGAKRAGVKIVYIPMENKNDLKEIKKNNTKLISNSFKVIPFSNINEIIFDILVSSDNIINK